MYSRFHLLSILKICCSIYFHKKSIVSFADINGLFNVDVAFCTMKFSYPSPWANLIVASMQYSVWAPQNSIRCTDNWSKISIKLVLKNEFACVFLIKKSCS